MSVEYFCPSCKASVQRRIESIVMCERCVPIALNFVDLVHSITTIESDLGDYLNSATRDEMLDISESFGKLIAVICHEARKLADGNDARLHALIQHERSSESHAMFDRFASETTEQHRDAQTDDDSGEVMR